MSTRLSLTPLPDYAAVRLEVDDAPAGELVILRSDANGQQPVRLLEGQAPASGVLVATDYEPALHGPVTYSVPGTRTNLLANTSGEVDASAWANGGNRTPITRVADAGAPNGAYVLRATATVAVSAGNGYVYQQQTTTPGRPHSASAWVRPSAAGAYLLRVRYLDAGSLVVGTKDTGNVNIAAGAWTQLRVDGAQAPANATTVQWFLYCMSSLAAGAYFDWDAALLEESLTAGPYLEGTTDATVKGTVSLDLGRPVVAVAVSPNLRADVYAFTDGDENSDDGSVVHRILDSPWSVSIAGEMGARTGTLVAWCDSYESAYALRAVCSTTDAVLIRHPEHTGMDLYAKVRNVNVSPRAELVTDELGARRRWSVTLGYLEQPAPAGPLLAAAGWSVADVVATFDTVADVAAAFATVRALTVGP